jgi:asparagine synthase (glutamine-hydrolysing)
VLIREHLRIEANPRIDEESILNAYERWGDDCVKHLTGDFAFAIRDERRQRVFCARDHLGVKPFFYTHASGDFKFSSTLNELRCGSETLNEIAVGDYLLFGVNQDNSTTIFKDIQRLPPGHTLTIANNEIKVRCYWEPTVPVEELRFRDPQEYVDRFLELLTLAVKDRLRTDRVAISMSGGLDSTSLAAVASEHTDVAGFVVVYDSLIPDEERHYSSLAAKHLGIPVTHLSADQYGLFDGKMDQAEPFLISALTGQFNELLRLCAEFASVALTGYDGDALMHEPRVKLRTRIKRMLRKQDLVAEALPEWVDGEFARRTNLKERWREFWARSDQFNRRPETMRALKSKIWTSLFEGYDAGSTKLPLEVRHPFLDVRLIEYLLAIPPAPWCVNKHILRRAMSDKLPAAVLNRPKTGLMGDPALQLVRRASVRWLDNFEVSTQLRAFVNLNRRRPVAEEKTSAALWASLRVFALNYWLTNSQPNWR